jgi:hypothetical protein
MSTQWIQKLMVDLTPSFCINLLEQTGSFTNVSSNFREPRALVSTSESGLEYCQLHCLLWIFCDI